LLGSWLTVDFMRVLYSRVGLGVGWAACWARLLQACCEAQLHKTVLLLQDQEML
jgi:hypothetical protein